MKLFIVLALVAAAAADVSHLDAAAEIVKQISDVLPDQFNYAYETSNGILGQESGSLKSVGKDEVALVVQGSNQYTAPDGTRIQLTYTADENGYQPQGAHLPTPPAPQPIPEYIARSIEYIRAHPPKEEPQKRF